VPERYKDNPFFNFVKENCYCITWKIGFVTIKKELKMGWFFGKVDNICYLVKIKLVISYLVEYQIQSRWLTMLLYGYLLMPFR